MGVGDFFRQKSAATAAVYLGYGDWSPGVLPLQEVEYVWHVWHLPRVVHFQIHISTGASNCQKLGHVSHPAAEEAENVNFLTCTLERHGFVM